MVNSCGTSLHEGASRSSRLANWSSRNVGANDEAVTELALLRDRVRSLRRNNPWINRAINVYTAYHIGTGAKPRPITTDEEFNKRILELWRDWIWYADYSNQKGSIYHIQQELVRGKAEAGEAFAILHNTSDNGSSPVSFKVQVLESDQCPLYYNRLLKNGNEIVSGIELTPNGKIVAYYFYRQHPNISLIKSNVFTDVVRVKASKVIHYFSPERPSQLRGRPLPVASMVKAKTYDEYTDSELVRKNTKSKFTGTIEREHYSEADYNVDPITGVPLKDTDEFEVPEIQLEAGNFPALLPGEKVNLFDADDTGIGFQQFQEWAVLAISSGMSVPYQLVSGDWKVINDRVWRAIFNDFKRHITQEQNNKIVPLILRPIWIAFINRAIITGAISQPSISKWEMYRCNFKFQAFDYLHPVQDVDSDIRRMEAGFESRESIIDKRSDDDTVLEVDIQRANDKRREDELGLTSYEDRVYGDPNAQLQQTQDNGDSNAKQTDK